MAFNFPSSPAIGDTANGYKWDGTAWIVIGSDGVGTGFVLKTGDTMTGPLNLSGPSHWSHSGVGAGSFYSTALTPNAFFLGTDATGELFRLYAAGAAVNALTVDNATGNVAFAKPVTLAAGPTATTHATDKQYVDGKVRARLATARIYYVRTDGNNANTGLTNDAAGAFLTIQRAVDVTAALDTNGFGVTIQVANGTYGAGALASKPFHGGGTVQILGNVTTPASVVVSLVGGGNVFSATNGAYLTVKGFKVTNTVAGAGLYAVFGGMITADRMDFGSVAGDHVEAADDGVVSLFNGSYTISGGGSSHWHAHGGKITAAFNTVTLTGTPVFANYFAGIAFGMIQCQNNTFTGTATGPRYLIHFLGFMLTGTSGNINYLPGSTAGSLTEGGQYDQRFSSTQNVVVIDNPGLTLPSATLQFQKLGVVQADIYDDGTNTVVANAAHTAGMFMTHGSSAWTAISDRRFTEKANARDVTVLDKLAHVRLVEYGENYREIGVIAQEFVEAFPQLVNVGDAEDKQIASLLEPGAWGMMYDRAGVIALQGLKEATAQIAELRAEIAVLKQRVP